MDPNQSGLPITGAKPVNVPAFTCIVYVSSAVDSGQADAGVTARVANLGDIQFTAPTERDALSKIVPAFKERVTQHLSKNEPIPWIEPASPMESYEQERLLPVHL